MAVYQVHSVIGAREDLTDLIVNISPTEHPIYSAARKVSARAVLHEWQSDALVAASTNEKVEGADATFPTLNARTRIGNFLQIASHSFFVSDTLEAVSLAGVESEYAYQSEKAMKQLGIDIEFDIIRNASSGGSTSTARAMDGIDTIIATNTSTSGSNRDLDRPLFMDMHQTVYDSGGNPNVTLVNAFQKRQVSGFTLPSGGSRNIAMADKRLIDSVDVIESDFGLMKVMLDRHMPSDKLFMLEMAMIRIAVLRAVHHKPLPDDGGGPRGKIEVEHTLEYGNEAAFGEIANLTTS